MSSIPTNIVTVNFPDDGGGGGSDSNADIRSIMETLRHVQGHIASINTNVRSILETLRRCCARGGMRPGGGGGGGGGRGGGGGMSEAERTMRGGMNRAFSAAMIEARYTSRMNPRMTTRDILPPTHYNLLERFMSNPAELSPSEQARGARLRAFDLSVRGRNLAESGRNSRSNARIAARQQGLAARAQAAQAAAAAHAQAAATAAAGRRMQGGMSARLDELRRRAAEPGATVASLGLTPEEHAVLSGQASPSGLPGTRSHARSIAGIVAGVNAANAPQPQQNGMMTMVTGIGRVVATMNLIVGLIKTGIDVIMWGSRQTRDNISSFSRLDPFMAKLNTGMMLSDMYSDMQTARNPDVRMAMSKYANSQIANTSSFQGMKDWWTQETAEMGKFGNQIGTLTSILLTGGENMSVLERLEYVGSFFYPWGEDVRDTIDSKYATQRIAEMRGAGNVMFLNDLNAMTGGRFQSDISATVNGGGKNNWWTGRGNF